MFSVLFQTSLLALFLFFAYESPAIASTSNKVSVSADYLFFKHENYNVKDETLNSEKGWIPGLQVAYKSISKNLEGIALLEKYTGDVSFDGIATNGPFSSKTNEDLTRFSYRLNAEQSRSDYNFYTLLSFHNLRRNILSTASISGREYQYQWLSLEGGVTVDLYSTRKNVISAEFGLSRTLFSKLQIDLSKNNLGKPVLRLGDKFGGSASLTYKHMFNRYNGVNLLLQIKYWQFGKSESKSITNDSTTEMITEPQSQSLSTALGIGYFYKF
ncbi:MAG: hypothetical protein OEX07_01325 [Gammaproteobacteria bacterium]|nr:hypothetical protein [Gammaproteobacteria bacterium]